MPPPPAAAAPPAAPASNNFVAPEPVQYGFGEPLRRRAQKVSLGGLALAPNPNLSANYVVVNPAYLPFEVSSVDKKNLINRELCRTKPMLAVDDLIANPAMYGQFTKAAAPIVKMVDDALNNLFFNYSSELNKLKEAMDIALSNNDYRMQAQILGLKPMAYRMPYLVVPGASYDQIIMNIADLVSYMETFLVDFLNAAFGLGRATMRTTAYTRRYVALRHGKRKIGTRFTFDGAAQFHLFFDKEQGIGGYEHSMRNAFYLLQAMCYKDFWNAKLRNESPFQAFEGRIDANTKGPGIVDLETVWEGKVDYEPCALSKNTRHHPRTWTPEKLMAIIALDHYENGIATSAKTQAIFSSRGMSTDLLENAKALAGPLTQLMLNYMLVPRNAVGMYVHGLFPNSAFPFGNVVRAFLRACTHLMTTPDLSDALVISDAKRVSEKFLYLDFLRTPLNVVGGLKQGEIYLPTSLIPEHGKAPDGIGDPTLISANGLMAHEQELVPVTQEYKVSGKLMTENLRLMIRDMPNDLLSFTELEVSSLTKRGVVTSPLDGRKFDEILTPPGMLTKAITEEDLEKGELAKLDPQIPTADGLHTCIEYALYSDMNLIAMPERANGIFSPDKAIPDTTSLVLPAMPKTVYPPSLRTATDEEFAKVTKYNYAQVINLGAPKPSAPDFVPTFAPMPVAAAAQAEAEILNKQTKDEREERQRRTGNAPSMPENALPIFNQIKRRFP